VIILSIIFIFLSKHSFSHDEIIHAIVSEDRELVEAFLQEDRSVLYKELVHPERPEESVPLLFLAIEIGNLEIIELLLQCGANPNMRTERGCTPMLCALRMLNHNIVNMLLSYGAKLTHVPAFVSGAGRTLWDTVRALQAAQESCIEFRELAAAYAIRARAFDLEQTERFIFDETTPLCTKLSALECLLRIKKKFPEAISDHKIKHYYHHVQFTYAFFENKTIFEYALKRRFPDLVDVREKSLEKSIEDFLPKKAIAKVASRVLALQDT